MGFLKVEGAEKSFRGFKAVNDVDLTVEEGERRAVIGPNGAGKTTLFNLLTGLLRMDAGAVRLGDLDITGLPPHKIAAVGVARAFQITSIFGRLSVRRNVQIALMSASGTTSALWGSGWSRKLPETASILDETGLADLAETPAGTLSHGDQRALELAIALALDPKLLILDEPTAGMAPEETSKALGLIRRVVAESGITLLFSEHDMEVVFDTADRVTVMTQGAVLAEGSPDEIRTNPQVQEVYLGSADAAG